MPQWPGTNENFALIIGMYFKILSVPNYGKRVFYVHLAYRWCCYRLGMPGALTRACTLCGEFPHRQFSVQSQCCGWTGPCNSYYDCQTRLSSSHQGTLKKQAY